MTLTDPSYQPPAPDTLEILPAPGAVEAAAIRADHAVATAGMRAFVRMGFRLMDVKSRLPHGKYVKWCEEYLGDLSRRHLHRAKFIAESFGKWDMHVPFENLSPEILAIIDGASGIHALLAEVHEFPECIGSEANAKELCEARWLRHPEERDDWEPRVLSGELNYHRALTGMLGSSATAGKKRDATQAGALLNSAAGALKLHFIHYDQITPTAQEIFLTKISEAMELAPDPVKKAVLVSLKGFQP